MSLFGAASQQQPQQPPQQNRQASRGIPVELYFKGHDLLKADFFSDSDPYLILYEIPENAPIASNDAWVKFRREVGRTEVQSNNLHPIWGTVLRVRYVIGAKQRFLCRLLDDDVGKTDEDNDPLGDVSFYLHDVMVAPNSTIIAALPTQGSITITAHVSLRGEGMSIERVAVPRTATVVDALQKSTRVREQGTTDISFPSSAAFWKELHRAIALAPSTAQAPPHLHIECTDHGDGILVNKVFLIDFLDQWNESVTHTLTLTVGDGSRAFRAVPMMWEQLLTHVADNPQQARDGEATVEVESNHDPHRRKVKLPWTQWSNFCRRWDQQHDTAPGDTFGGGPPTVEEQVRRKQQEVGRISASGIGGDIGGDFGTGAVSSLMTPEQQAQGIFPSWTDRSQRMPCTSSRGMARNVSSTGTYWTNFMREWTILQAAARNHLPSGHVGGL